MSGPYPDLEADLATLVGKARLRTLRPREGVDFASNDYLGLAGGLGGYLIACAGFTLLFGLLAGALLRWRDVRA